MAKRVLPTPERPARRTEAPGEERYERTVNSAASVESPSAQEVTLSPGMPADVMILTGERTLWEYLVRPLYVSFTKALRET
jgi:multidrug efflux pump subunit AcrA (membrane-fusion protein)